MTFPILSLQALMDTLAAEFPLLELTEEHFLNPTVCEIVLSTVFELQFLCY